jgi:hypothetical protein
MKFTIKEAIKYFNKNGYKFIKKRNEYHFKQNRKKKRLFENEIIGWCEASMKAKRVVEAP